MLKLDILADDEPEPDEYVTVRIERVEPQDTQHIKSGSATIQLIIQENDNPGGVFHFAHQMALAYTVQVEFVVTFWVYYEVCECTYVCVCVCEIILNNIFYDNNLSL